MADLPRKQREYFSNITKAVESGDDEMLADLVRQKTPKAIREDFTNVLGGHVNDNYDNPLNIFENKKLLEELPVTYTNNLPKGIAGQYVKQNGLYLPKEDLSNLSKQTGVKVHEYGHYNDLLKGFDESQPFQKTKALLNNTGLQAAEDAFGKHHASGFFEKEALADLLKNKKLATALPLLKAAGVGALGYQALGIGQKAMAGDIGEAGLDAADMGTDFIPGVGEAKMAISPTQMGNAELPPEVMEERERFNKTKQKLRIPQPM